MAIQNGFFKSINGDRRYLAEFFTSYFASFIGNGVFPNPSTNLQVINNQNFSTIVRPGKGWINGHYLNNDDNIVINHQPPDGVLRRIDRIVFAVNLDSRSMDIYLKQGTPSSAAVAPPLIRNSTLYELALSDIAINPGMVSISQSNITDQRMNKALCGIVHGVVEQLDTTTLFNQYQQFLVEKGIEFDQQLAVNQQVFDDWFAQLNDILDGDVAANLANMIITHTNNATPQKHIEVVSAIPQNLENKGLLLVVDDVDNPNNPPEIPTSMVLSNRIDAVNLQSLNNKQSIEQISINVKTLGAKGDGVTNDLPIIQQAIDMAVQGQEVYLPAGNYLIVGSIQFRQHTILKGNRSSIFYRGTGTAIKAEGSELQFVNPVMEGILVHKEGYDKIGVGLSVQFSRAGGRFIDCTFRGFEYGIIHSDPVNFAWYNSFNGCNIRDNRVGVSLLRNSNGVSFYDCTIRRNDDLGVFVQQGNNVRLIGCGLEYNGRKSGGKAIFLDRANSTLISGCYFESNGFDDTNSPVILMGSTVPGQRTTMTQISNNYFNGFESHTIVKGAADNRSMAIYGNTFYDNNPPSAWDIDISEMTSTVWVNISGNRASGADRLNVTTNPDPTSWIQHGSVVNKYIFEIAGGTPRIILNDRTSSKRMRLDNSNDVLRILNDAGQVITQFKGSSRQSDIAISSGSTSNRPSAYAIGHMYFDTTINKPIWWNGTAWVDSVGTTV